MEQREQRANLFGLCRVVTEEDEVNLFGLCRAPRNEGRITKPLLTSIRHLQSDKWSVTAFLMTYSYNVKNCHILPQERLFLHREDIFTLRTIRKRRVFPCRKSRMALKREGIPAMQIACKVTNIFRKTGQ